MSLVYARTMVWNILEGNRIGAWTMVWNILEDDGGMCKHGNEPMGHWFRR